jgi:hypothetical protein
MVRSDLAHATMRSSVSLIVLSLHLPHLISYYFVIFRVSKLHDYSSLVNESFELHKLGWSSNKATSCWNLPLSAPEHGNSHSPWTEEANNATIGSETEQFQIIRQFPMFPWCALPKRARVTPSYTMLLFPLVLPQISLFIRSPPPPSMGRVLPFILTDLRVF